MDTAKEDEGLRNERECVNKGYEKVEIEDRGSNGQRKCQRKSL